MTTRQKILREKKRREAREDAIAIVSGVSTIFWFIWEALFESYAPKYVALTIAVIGFGYLLATKKG